MKKSILVSLVSVMMPMFAAAQALPFIASDYDPATLAKGGASSVQTSSIAYSALHNPAAIPFSELKADVAAAYAMWAPAGVSTNVINVAGAYNMNQKLGVTAALVYGTNPAYDVTDAAGAAKGKFKPTEMQLKAGVSYRFLPFLSVGANLGYASSKLAQNASYGSFDADVFLMAKFGEFKLAAGVSDLGGGITSTSGVKYSLPTAAVLGLGYQAEMAQKHGIGLQADADYYLSGAFAAAFGLCYDYDDMVFVRAGYRYGGKSVLPSFVSLGLGVKFAGVRLDLAYLTASSLSNTIALGLGYSF